MNKMVTSSCCMSPNDSENPKEGCNKAYFLEGWIGGFVKQLQQQLSRQERFILQLEQRIVDLENTLKDCSKD